MALQTPFAASQYAWDWQVLTASQLVRSSAQRSSPLAFVQRNTPGVEQAPLPQVPVARSHKTSLSQICSVVQPSSVELQDWS
jgi:hypothetical protein